nr:hypothetical protein [Tanacetum cinerariifolium]
MDLFAFIHAPDPTKVRVVERERDEDESRLLETTVGRIVSLLLITPDRTESELKAIVDRLFNESGSGHQTKQGDSAGGGQDANIQPAVKAVDTIVEDAAPVLLVGALLNAEVGVVAIPTLSFVAAFVSITPKREDGGHTDSVVEHNLRTVGAPRRFVISSDSSHHSSANVAEAEVDSLIREKVIEPSLFSAGYFFASGTDPITCVFADLTGSDFLIGDIRTIINPDTDLQKTHVPQRSVTNGSCLDDDHFHVGAARKMSLSAEVRMCAEYNIKEKMRLKSVADEQAELLKVREKEIENLKAQLSLKEAEAAEAIHLRAQASELETVERSLRDETNALKERNAILEKERDALDVKVTELETSAVGKERELTDLNALVTSVKSQNDNLVDRVHSKKKITMYENSMEQLEKFQDDQIKIVNDKFDNLHTDFVDMTLHLEERFYPHLLTTISVRRWLLTHDIELAIAKCLNSPDYLSALGATIGTSDAVPATAITTSMSTTLALTSTVNLISIDDYEFVDADDQAVAGEDAASFPNVDDAELRIPQ